MATATLCISYIKDILRILAVTELSSAGTSHKPYRPIRLLNSTHLPQSCCPESDSWGRKHQCQLVPTNEAALGQTVFEKQQVLDVSTLIDVKWHAKSRTPRLLRQDLGWRPARQAASALSEVLARIFVIVNNNKISPRYLFTSEVKNLNKKITQDILGKW